VKLHYIAGYECGFYDRKRRETNSREDLMLSRYRASSRATIAHAGMPWWSNYTRERS
jgi:hypothetical protein